MTSIAETTTGNSSECVLVLMFVWTFQQERCSPAAGLVQSKMKPSLHAG